MLKSKLLAFVASVVVFFLMWFIMESLGYTYKHTLTKAAVIIPTFMSYNYLKPKNIDKED
jgi:hypothetical protein